MISSHDFWLLHSTLCRISITPSVVSELFFSPYYRDLGSFTQLDRYFGDGLKYPFSLLSQQFGTLIAVDSFSGMDTKREGGRCLGDNHSMSPVFAESTCRWSWHPSAVSSTSAVENLVSNSRPENGSSDSEASPLVELVDGYPLVI